MRSFALALCALVCACTTRAHVTPPVDGGHPQDEPDTGTPFVYDGGHCAADCGALPPRPRDCAPGTEWIYLMGYANGPVTRDGPTHDLLKYRPDTGEVSVVGEVVCAVGFTPFSMAVDRSGIAWVLSARGLDGLFRVDTTDASCEATSYVPDQGGFEEFGMGFAADARDSMSESLYLIGGPQALIHHPGAETLFGVLHLDTLEIETRARLTGMGEMTGTGEGNLWAYLQLSDANVITRLDPTTGDRSTTYSFPPADEFAFAMAFWGGDFYLFVAGSLDSESQILRVRGRTGEVTGVGTVPGHAVVGAGVSTCAPYDLI